MIIRITKGDKYPVITTTVKKDDVEYDCTGSTAFFYIRNKLNGHVYRVPCIIDHGKIKFSFTDASTSEAGVYLGNYYVTFPDGSMLSIPNEGYIDVIIKESVSEYGATIDPLTYYADKLRYGNDGKSYSDIHLELETHSDNVSAHHSPINDPSANQKAALNASLNPSSSNRYVTYSELATNVPFRDNVVFKIENNLNTTTLLPHLFNREQVISGVKGYIQVLPRGQNILFDIRKNDPAITSNSIFSAVQSIATNLTSKNGMYQFDLAGSLNNAKLKCVSEDTLYLIILRVGSTVSGAGLCINVMC
jgi:hypothetical protein